MITRVIRRKDQVLTQQGAQYFMTTMRDIAEAANVSRSAVSAVLNGNCHIRVSKEKRELILDLARKMNYRPNLIARSLVSRSSYTIGIYLCMPTEYFYAELLAAIQEELRQRNYIGSFIFWKSLEDVQYAYDIGQGQRVDGIITCHGDVSMLPPGTPAVIFGTEQESRDCFFPDWPRIYDSYLNHLVSLGHRKIMFVGNEDNRPFQMKALKKLAVKYGVEIQTVPGGINRQTLIATAKKIAGSPRSSRPTAIITANDMNALDFINAAKNFDLRIPQDISIIGYDNIQDTLYSSPPLTTSGVPVKKLAGDLMDTLFKRMAEPDAPFKKVKLFSELIVRSSCTVPLPD